MPQNAAQPLQTDNATAFRPPTGPLADRILNALMYRIGKDARAAKPHDWLTATVLTVRDQIIDRWMASTRAAHAAGAKRVYYLSLEFLIGRLLRDSLSNLGVVDELRAALSSLGVDLDVIRELEPDAALGNGGLGRLAACFMESLASLDLPAYGYGIRYVNGMFRQRIDDGWQVELPETWLVHGNPWEFERRESDYAIGFGGEVIANSDGQAKWWPAERLIAVAIDTPVVGWRGKRVNTLRLWTAQALDPIRLDAFNAGDHIGALADEQPRRKPDARALSGRLQRRPARNCGCGRSISFRPRRSRTSCAATCSISATCAPWPIRRRSSSTTPIRRCRWPN